MTTCRYSKVNFSRQESIIKHVTCKVLDDITFLNLNDCGESIVNRVEIIFECFCKLTIKMKQNVIKQHVKTKQIVKCKYYV